MYVEMLEQGIAPSRDREQEYFHVLGSESARLARLVDNVLEFSRLEKKQRRFSMQEGTFDDVVSQVQTIMQQKLREEGFVFTVEKGEVRPFKYDREVMVQVLINLIDNSIKFGKEAAEKKILMSVRSESEHTTITVSDTGPGIPPQAIGKVFDDFYRVDNSLTRTARGSGIGLALVKKLITTMGGTVVAVNNDGPGCRIVISFPNLGLR
jgi:signal transduction histidine kinase